MNDSELVDALKSLLDRKNSEIECLKKDLNSLRNVTCSFKADDANIDSTSEKNGCLELKKCSCTCHLLKDDFDHIDAFTQTFESDFNETVSTNSALDWATTEGANTTVSDLVQEVCNENTFQSDYVYDENFKMYHSPSTGYYYDHEKNLLYDPFSQTYYRYDQEKNSYEFVYQFTVNTKVNAQKPDSSENVLDEVSRLKLDDGLNKMDLNKTKLTQKKNKRYRKNTPQKSNNTVSENKVKLKEPSPHKEPRLEKLVKVLPNCDSSPEEGEILSDSSEDFSIYSNEDNCLDSRLEGLNTWQPCIRAIIQQSSHQNLGSLLLIPCTGGVIGRDKSCDIYIPDISVSRAHARVLFEEESWVYSIVDLGSQNGTFVNDTKLQESDESLAHSLKHDDVLTLGSCKLLLHIHPRALTCNKCEPGLVQAEIASQKSPTSDSFTTVKTRDEIEKERKQVVKGLKKKFGLQEMDYISAGKTMFPNEYQDRADKRRKAKGSQNPHEKDQAASTEIALSDSNKGYKMLKSMGWKDGTSLGANNTGMIEPVQMHYQFGRTGLGSEDIDQPKPKSDPKLEKWIKAQKRYYETDNVLNDQGTE